MILINEFGRILAAQQFGGSLTTPGATVTEEFNVIPGFVHVHVGLARVAAAEAVIGIVEFTRPHGGGTANFGSQADWETAIYGPVSSFTIGVFVARGIMKGWFFVQAWS